MDKSDLSSIIHFAVDADKQVEEDHLLLTLQDIEQIVGEGCIDFNGINSEEARRVRRPARRSSAEKSGWWDLAQGVYWFKHKERIEIPEGYTVCLQPHKGIMVNGLWHPTLLVTDWDRDAGNMLLTVAARGVRVFENSIISVARLLRIP